MKTEQIANGLQLAGAGGITAAALSVNVWLGVFVGSVLAVVAGVVIERG